MSSSDFVTFVLGAGASYEVAMPTGNQLKKRISETLAFKVDDISRQLIGGNDAAREALYYLSQSKNGEINAYYRTASLIARGMPQAPSIDNFIDSHRSDPKIAEVGKIAIASAILQAERRSKLWFDASNAYSTINFSSVEDTWFHEFFQLLTLNCPEDQLSNRLKKIRVVSFNYDRTFEHFLYHAIQNYYDCSAERAAEILSHLTVLHPYGQVGALPWQKDLPDRKLDRAAARASSVQFGASLRAPALYEVSTVIKTFTEGTDEEDSEIQKIRDSVLNARTITFLGFAFHQLNLQLLYGLSPDRHDSPPRRLFGTALGISISNLNEIQSDLLRLGHYQSNQVFLQSTGAAQLLQEFARVLQIPD